MSEPHRLILILGDQLDRRSAALADLDPVRDRVWMAEVREEASQVPSHKARIALFLAAMRHFAAELRGRGVTVDYAALDAHSHPGLAEALDARLTADPPSAIVAVEPGVYRLRIRLEAVCQAQGIPLEWRDDRHFIAPRAEFERWARGKKQLRLEGYYRRLRTQMGLLMEGDEPVGGRWNFDTENRKGFGRSGPGPIPQPLGTPPDGITREVLRLVAEAFPDHPGRLEDFDWPMTPVEAEAAWADFRDHRLPHFGRFQDAMWTGEPFLYHARLSTALNLKLIEPRPLLQEAEAEYRAGRAPLAAVEGFIRQVLGWREYVRGLYWRYMPDWADWNLLGAEADLPDFYWTGATAMTCLREAIGQVLRYGYGHHIQRLMVTGLYPLLLGVEPRQVHTWYLAMYVDAVEWVELPNTLGMSQYADGGIMASKPYVASGKYIQKMSNYCRHCRFDPGEAVGAGACPFTTLYWDFLERHQARFAKHPRTALQWRNLERLDSARLAAIRNQAGQLRAHGGQPPNP